MKAPATSGKKRLHVFWFIDASQTRKFSIPLLAFLILACAFLIVLTSFGFLVPMLLKQGERVREREAYVRELKSILIERTAPTPVQEVAAAIPAAQPPVATRTPQPSATPQTPTPRPTAPAQPRLHVKRTVPASGPNVAGDVNIENFRATAVGPAETRVDFALVSTNPEKNRFIEGYICVQAYDRQARPAGSFPADLAVAPETALPPPAGCTRGEYVRFARFRPSSVTLPVARETLDSLDIFLLFRGSGEFFARSHQVEPNQP